MNRRGLFPALAASLLLGVTAVVAQDLTNFDPKAIEGPALFKPRALSGNADFRDMSLSGNCNTRCV